MSVLAIEGVAKNYRGGVAALRDVHLAIEAGDDLVIVGPSGSGKSTLLHIMGALERPSAGSVHVGGVDTAAASDAELSQLRGTFIGFVFQQAHLLPRLTAQQNVALGLQYAGIERRHRPGQARAALVRVGLGHRLTHIPSALSGGERQRVGIARAIAAQPALVLADEPTGALDRATGNEILDLFHSLHAEGTTIAVITHDPQVASTFTRQIEISDGNVRETTR